MATDRGELTGYRYRQMRAGVTLALAVLGAWGITYAVPDRPKTDA
ncbi:hypothetical protein [Streptomyces sp. NPDC058683]